MPKLSSASAAKIETPASDRLTELIVHTMQLIAKAEEQEEAAKKTAADVMRLLRTDIPELLKELKLEEAVLKDLNIKVKLSSGVEASIPEEQRAAAFEWLAKNGYGAIVRAEVSCLFGAAELEKAEKCKAALLKAKYTPTVSMSVPAPTLKAWAKERLSQGKEIPPTIFKIHSYDMAKLTAVKKRAQ
jgi:hypothetical protein